MHEMFPGPRAENIHEHFLPSEGFHDAEPTSRDKVRVQVQVRATPGLGFLVLLLWTVQLYHKKQLFLKKFKHVKMPQTYIRLKDY
jgi:hypothetical protein